MMKTHQNYCAAEGGENFGVYSFFFIEKSRFFEGDMVEGDFGQRGVWSNPRNRGGMVDGEYGGYDRKIMHWVIWVLL